MRQPSRNQTRFCRKNAHGPKTNPRTEIEPAATTQATAAWATQAARDTITNHTREGAERTTVQAQYPTGRGTDTKKQRRGTVRKTSTSEEKKKRHP